MATVRLIGNYSLMTHGMTFYKGRATEVSEELAKELEATGKFTVSFTESVEETVSIEEEIAKATTAAAVKELAAKYDIDVSHCKNNAERKAAIIAAFAGI